MIKTAVILLRILPSRKPFRREDVVISGDRFWFDRTVAGRTERWLVNESAG